MTEPIKEQIIFDDERVPLSSSTEDESLTPETLFDEKVNFVPMQEQKSQEEQDQEKALESHLAKILAPPRKRPFFKRLLKGGLYMTGVLCVWQVAETIYNAWLAQDLLTIGWSVAVLLLASAGVSAFIRELFILKRLRRREKQKHQAQKFSGSHGVMPARVFCQNLAKELQMNKENPYYDRFLNTLTDNHTETEVIELFDAIVLSKVDKQALYLIKKQTKQSAVMVAVSPLAIADIFLVAWCNLALIQDISKIYGVELGYWSRLSLFKMVLFNMAFAGISEFAIDTGIDALSLDLTAKLSSRVAQGVGVGLISARLGLKTMEMLRPLSYAKDCAPKLADIRKSLLSDFT